MYHRVGPVAYKSDLSNTYALIKLLGHPEKDFKSIHIAGTNGKGSVSHFISSILQEKKLKVGLYTSPHLKDFRERIKINGQQIPKKYVIDFVKQNKEKFEEIGLSFFEMTVGLAFKYFSEEKVDIAVIETGLGGRLDSTNVIKPMLSVITNISYDHTALLGNTLEKIAIEKAGIIKENTAVVIGEKHKETQKIFRIKAKELNAPIYFAQNKFKASICKPENKRNLLWVDIYSKKGIFIMRLASPLAGIYQKKNLLTVLQCIEVLNDKSITSQLLSFSEKKPVIRKITNTEIKKGIENVIINTGLQGRWQVIAKNPLRICDIGHNEAGIKEVCKQIKMTTYKKLHIVYGMVNDKEAEKIMKHLPKKASYYFCKPNIPRGLDTKVIFTIAKKYRLKGMTYSSVKNALTSAQKKAHKEDLIFIGGSTFVVAEVI